MIIQHIRILTECYKYSTYIRRYYYKIIDYYRRYNDGYVSTIFVKLLPVHVVVINKFKIYVGIRKQSISLMSREITT